LDGFAPLSAFVISISHRAGTNIACPSSATKTSSAQSLASSWKHPASATDAPMTMWSKPASLLNHLTQVDFAPPDLFPQLPHAFYDFPVSKHGLRFFDGDEHRPKSAMTGNRAKWFNPACFTLPLVGHYRDLGRNSLTSPGLRNLDFAILEDTRVPKVSETFDVQFRAEAFNLFNHTDLGLPVTGLF
jgi:hypothetical protein